MLIVVVFVFLPRRSRRRCGFVDELEEEEAEEAISHRFASSFLFVFVAVVGVVEGDEEVVWMSLSSLAAVVVVEPNYLVD